MRFPSYDRWKDLGNLLASIGGSCAFGWYIYARQSDGKTHFLAPLGMAFLAITGIGVLLLGIGFFNPKEKGPTSSSSPPSATSGRERIGYDIADDGEVESHNAHIRNQDTAFKVRGRGKLREDGADIG
jgi:hypothetical protein